MHPFHLPDLADERVRTYRAEADEDRRSRRAGTGRAGDGLAARGRLRWPRRRR